MMWYHAPAVGLPGACCRERQLRIVAKSGQVCWCDELNLDLPYSEHHPTEKLIVG
jgi:hypothetical protein